MKTTTERASQVWLGPADELTVTVDMPKLVQVVEGDSLEPVDVWMSKQWGTEHELRRENMRLRSQVKRLTWELEYGRTTAGAWAEVATSARECWRLITEALTGRKGR